MITSSGDTPIGIKCCIFFPNSKILIKSSDAVGILKLNRHLFVFDFFFFFAEKGKDGQASRARSQVNDIPKNSDNNPPHNK